MVAEVLHGGMEGRVMAYWAAWNVGMDSHAISNRGRRSCSCESGGHPAESVTLQIEACASGLTVPELRKRGDVLEAIVGGLIVRLAQVVGRLEVQPHLWRGVEPPGQAQRGVGADATSSPDGLGDPRPRDTESARASSACDMPSSSARCSPGWGL